MQTRAGKFPLSRQAGLLVEEIGDELLIYDTTNDRAHTLNRTAALVWKLCDGKVSVGEIAKAAGKEMQQPFSEQMVWFTLAKLEEYQLLDISFPTHNVMAGMSRREFITKFAVAAAVVPVVKTLKVPTAGLGGSCQGSGQSCIEANCCEGLVCCGSALCFPTGSCSG